MMQLVSLWLLVVAAISVLIRPAAASFGDECRAAGGGVCFPKCCPASHVLEADKKCHRSEVEFKLPFENKTASIDPKTYTLVYGDPCENGKYFLQQDVPEEAFELLADGTLKAPYAQDTPLHGSQYCIETLVIDNVSMTVPFICFPVSKAGQSSPLSNVFYPVGLLVSVPFLVLTVYIYLSIPQLRDIHGGSLCCYASCMAVAYLSLAIIQLGNDNFNHQACIAFAYIIQFSFVSCFFWLNVLCIDVFWNILATTGVIKYYPCLPQWRHLENRGWVRMDDCVNRREDQIFAKKVFIGYSVYAWGLPLILLLIVIIMDLSPAVPTSYLKPNFGDTACWFGSQEAALQYFYGPIGCILIINVVLFVITMYHVFKHPWNPRGPQRTPKQKARMCLILFLAMGISWVMEVVSWAVGGPPYVWAVLDAFNILQGIVVFCIFVMEPRVKYIVWSKMCYREDDSEQDTPPILN